MKGDLQKVECVIFRDFEKKQHPQVVEFQIAPSHPTSPELASKLQRLVYTKLDILLLFDKDATFDPNNKRR